MDTLQVVALIVVALVIVAVIIAYRHKLALVLQIFGFKLDVQAENEATQAPVAPAGVSVTEAESTAGGLLVEEGRSETGPGVEVKQVKVKDDIIIGKGESGSPKANPPT
jgi:hypothetical protein